MSVTISMKAPEELAERIEDAREDGESRSACIRRLTREALDDDDDDPQTLTLPILLVWFGTIVITSQYADPTVSVGPAGIGLVLLGVYFNDEDRHQRVKGFIGRYTGSKENNDDSESAGNTDQTG